MKEIKVGDSFRYLDDYEFTIKSIEPDGKCIVDSVKYGVLSSLIPFISDCIKCGRVTRKANNINKYDIGTKIMFENTSYTIGGFNKDGSEIYLDRDSDYEQLLVTSDEFKKAIEKGEVAFL